jgi:hypothetical protein
MKPLNEQQVWSKEKLARDHRLAVIGMIQQQIDVVQGIMERHNELVKAPLHYNMCCGLLDQLKTHAVAAFHDGEATAPQVTSGNSVPNFQFPNEILGL